MRMEFQKRKSEIIAAISSPLPDKSPKGFLDAPIVPLIDAINSHPSFFTTSSCSGRISITSHPKPNPSPNGSDKVKKKAGGGRWVFITHDPADPAAVTDAIFGGGDGEGDLVFRFEPLIIAVECVDVEAAQKLVSVAISCGFRESGITSVQRRIIIAIRCSIRLEVPLGQVGSIMVSQGYVRYLVEIANEKMEANMKRMDGLLHVLQYKVLSGSTDQMYTNEKNQGSVSEERRSVHLIAKQADSLSKLKLPEVDTLKYHYQDHVADVKAMSSSGSGSHSVESKSTEDSLKDLNLLHELEAGYNNEDIANADPKPGLSGTPKCSISVDAVMIAGEPTEKLFLWGQSAWTLNNMKHKQIVVFGGFGGVGRHERRNYSLLFDPQTGQVNEIDAWGPPSPRLGDTSSVIGDQVFIIGGRGGPTQILNDVWVLNVLENRWMLKDCTGSMFQPRHRHAAVAVGSYIYVFGGLNGDMIYSCMNVLNTDTLEWNEIDIQGEWPSARHSHSMIADGPQLFMFGGYDGEKALGDLYSFDIRTSLWKKEETSGGAPFARFSHCMFIYKNYLGIVGGCPLRQQNQELSLLNLENRTWMHVMVDSIGKDLWVRSSACIVDNNLVIIGGGTSCYAFGTKFNQPMKINLQLIDSLCGITTDKENKPPIKIQHTVCNMSMCNKHAHDASHISGSHLRNGVPVSGDAKDSVLQVDKKYAKLAKDILKTFGWLDLSRKVKPSQDDHHIYMPISNSFYSFYQKGRHDSEDIIIDFCQEGLVAKEGLSLDEVSIPIALRFLLSCGSTLEINDACCSRKVSKAPQKIMKESVSALLRKKGMPPKLMEQLPMRWERLGDIVVLPANSFKDSLWDSIGDELWPIIAKSLGAQRLARQGRILPTGTRDSTLEILVGDGSWVTHQENGILYSFDATKCMFSSGNLSEKLRMAHLDCTNEIIVDLFAGIGYFVLPFLMKAKAKLVYACEWNPHAVNALKHNVHANFVVDRCIILEGDNRVTSPKGVAHRVCLGLLPSSESSWGTAVRALRADAGELWYRPAIGSESNVGDFFNLCSAFTVAKIVLEENPISYHGYCHQRSHLSALPAKPTLDAEFLRVFRQRFYYAESCHNQVVEIPEGFPFEIQDDNGKSIITLRRKYRNENIEVIVGKADYKCDCVDFCECDYWDTSCIPLTVRVKKGESSPSLEIICTSYLDDVIINAVYLKQDPSSWGMLSYEGPDFNDLDENLQKAFQRYLELRGVSHVKLSCLHENGLDKCHRKYLHSLWSVRQFLER